MNTKESNQLTESIFQSIRAILKTFVIHAPDPIVLVDDNAFQLIWNLAGIVQPPFHL